MNDEAISSREVLQTVAEATGGEERLAALLEIDATELKPWLHGTRPPPFGTCIHALLVLERHRQATAQEQRGVVSIGSRRKHASGGFARKLLRALKPSDGDARPVLD
jgi:hypothetical protein